MSGISLTASMRSNLLSLQNISGQVSSTQNKLATGNKVNSAIDNPGSYYTALSLNNRADDLNALLDSMGQAVSTIKAATTALESAAGFLEQASAVATQALETAKIPSKSFFEEKVGANGAVVTTAQELRDAIAAGKETICVYGAIDLGDISASDGLTLQENQKLVGIGYFGNYDTDTNKFSSITASASVAERRIVDINQNGCVLSDLSLNYSTDITSGSANVVRTKGGGGTNKYQTTLRNLDVKLSTSSSNTSQAGRGAIMLTNGSVTQIEGKININASGFLGIGLFIAGSSSAYVNENAEVLIETSGNYGYGIYTDGAQFYSAQLSSIDIKTKGNYGYGFLQGYGGTSDISGSLCINTQQGNALYNSYTSGNTFNINSGAQVYLSVGSSVAPIRNGYDGGYGINILNVTAGAKLAIAQNNKTNWYEVKESWQDKNDSSTDDHEISTDNIKDKLSVEETAAWELPKKIEEVGKEETVKDLSGNSKQYQEIINQYDSLIKDASYKGINLLQNDKLSVKFNETNTADLSVQGKDMSSKALGFTVFDWQTQGDIADSLAEIANALQSIRNYSAELGNNYSIIATRQDFTESLVNVLTEGADKLALADMNEESANMLALQTRQQLAINSLSLASQASQSILKLF